MSDIPDFRGMRSTEGAVPGNAMDCRGHDHADTLNSGSIIQRGMVRYFSDGSLRRR